MSDAFVPGNRLEEFLVAAQNGEIPGEAFMQELVASQVFMPIRDKYQIAGLQTSDKAEPLTLKDEESGEEVLVLFTSPDRGRDFLQDFPEFKGGLLAEFPWIMERVGVGVGITLNPGLEVGLDLNGEMLEMLRGSAPKSE